MRRNANTRLAVIATAAVVLVAAYLGRMAEAAPSAPDETASDVLSAQALGDDGGGDLALKALEWIGSPVETSDGSLLGTLRGVRRSYEDGKPDRLSIERGDSRDFEVPLPGVAYRDGRVIVPATSLGNESRANGSATRAR